MPLTLITGPANAGKAERVFEALGAELARGAEPWLVVPTAADAAYYRRELAEAGAIVGVHVVRFAGLLDEMARRAGVPGRLIDGASREWMLAALAAAAPQLVPASWQDPGFLRELARLVGELQSRRVAPGRLGAALQALHADALSAEAPARGARALGHLYGAYHELLAASGWVDHELRAARAMDALRESPQLWGSCPVLFYGFDDLTAAQLDAIETLGSVVGAELVVALSYEPGRVAFAERAGAVETLLPWASSHVAVPPAQRHYAPAARDQLGHLERSLFEPACERRRAAGAVRLLEGASERAELGLVAAGVRELLERGFEAAEIAVVHRAPRTIAAGLSEAFRASGIPVAIEPPRPFGHTALGAGLLALLRCVLLDGDAQTLLRWLRAPGVVERDELVDRFEWRIRREGLLSAEQATAAWEQEHWPLSALARLREDAARGVLALIERLEDELWRMFARPRRALGAELAAEQLEEARALRGGLAALGSLRELLEAAPRRWRGPLEAAAAPAGLSVMLEALMVAADGGARGAAGRPDAVAVLDPLSLRARRVRALFLCGLQEGVFPGPPRVPALLGEHERRRLAERSGLFLGHQPETIAAERYLLYACVSRPEEQLALSWHTADDDGRALTRSLFVDDVCDVFEPGSLLWHRECGPQQGCAGRRDATALAGAFRGARPPEAPHRLRDERLLRALGGERLWSASALEALASCPVRWFVEHLLRPQGIDPDGEPLAEGTVLHMVLRDVVSGLEAETGSGSVTPERLSRALRLMRAALERRCEESPLAVSPERRAAARRRLEAALGRYLEGVAAQERQQLEPAHLEQAFGFEEDSLPALELGDGVRLRGRIDRVDVGEGGVAVVYDYKRRGRADQPGAKWLGAGTLQVALYMRAVGQLLGHDVVGGFYQPLTGDDLRARGALAADVQLPCVRTDRYERDELARLVDEAAGMARGLAAEAATGRLERRPQSCSPRGCRYAAICRPGR